MAANSKDWTVAFDAGHGAKHRLKNQAGKEYVIQDPGAVYGAYTEHKFARAIEHEIKKVAERFEPHGLKFVYTSSELDKHTYNKKAESLVARSNFAIKHDVDSFYSVHFDYRGEGEGKEGITTHFLDAADKKLATSVQKNLVASHTSNKDYGLKEDNFSVLRNCGAIPAVLIECGNSKEDSLRIPEWRGNIARAIVLTEVERAVDAGVKIPQEMVDKLRQECQSRSNMALGKAEDAGTTLIAAKAAKTEPVQIVPKKLTMDKEQMTQVAQASMPKVKDLYVDGTGNIYSKEKPGQSIGTFLHDDAIFIRDSERKTHSNGKPILTVDKAALASVAETKTKPAAEPAPVQLATVKQEPAESVYVRPLVEEVEKPAQVQTQTAAVTVQLPEPQAPAQSEELGKYIGSFASRGAISGAARFPKSQASASVIADNATAPEERAQPLSNTEQLLQKAQTALPSAGFTRIDQYGNLFSKDSPSTAVASYYEDNTKLFINKDFRQQLTNGASNVQVEAQKEKATELSEIDKAAEGFKDAKVKTAGTASKPVEVANIKANRGALEI